MIVLRKSALLLVSWCLYFCAGAQVLIHSHNDYLKPHPLTTAIDNKAYSIEADVFLVRENLLVAHSLRERRSGKTLQSLYIDPIVKLFKLYKGRISADTAYKTTLMIDIKQEGPLVLKELVALFDPLRNYFDRSVNPYAVQIVISGDRGPVSEWNNYPSYILFDGRPFEQYSPGQALRLGMMSDNYFNYLVERTNRGDTARIRSVLETAHQYKVPFRFWGAPDSEDTWVFLKRYGVDIINTDRIADCRIYFQQQSQ